MPLYDFRCLSGHRFERVVPLAQFEAVQNCACGDQASRLVSAPRVISDYIEPCLGADGKMHDSLASYRHSLTPEGNPRGERYIELGNESLKPNPPKFDEKQRRDDIKAAIEDVKNNRVPPLTVLED